MGFEGPVSGTATRHRSFWLNEALAQEREERTVLSGRKRYDVAIVGGGFCGLWTAINLKQQEPSLRVAIVERDICGGGASGRNAGYVLSLWARFPAMAAFMGEDEALRMARASTESIAEIGAYCATHGIDAEYENNGWLWGATCERHLGAWTSVAERLARFQSYPFREMPADEIAARWGLDGYLGGAFDVGAAAVQPAKLVRGLARRARALGVDIFEHSPMTALMRDNPPRVVTRDGEIVADRLALTMNAWSVGLPEFRRSLLIAAAEAAVSPPMPEILARMGFAKGPVVTDSRIMVGNLRPTAGGRLEFGKGGGHISRAGRVGERFEGVPPRLALLLEETRQTSSHLTSLQVAESWVGPIDRTAETVPMFGVLPGSERIFFGCGFSGNGVGPTHLGGKILASLILGLKDQWSASGLVRPPSQRFPDEPVRMVGAKLVLAAVARKDRLDHQGRPTGPITRRLAGFAPAALTPSKR
ncbi:MAG: FAD-dependent oxidoreductase [Roseomonas sp.]|nr:FAD-dependent oxidoreductase [Roseomonas sp.]